MSDYLIHHGIQGQKWGVRRYQNPDGSLTAAGKRRYAAEMVEHPDTVSKKKIAKGMQRLLNDTEESIREESVREAENKRKASAYRKKVSRMYAKLKDKNVEPSTKKKEKYDKLVDRHNEYVKKAQENRKAIKEGEQFCADLLNKLSDTKDFSVLMRVESYTSTKYETAGRKFLAYAFGIYDQALGARYKVKYEPTPPVLEENG